MNATVLEARLAAALTTPYAVALSRRRMAIHRHPRSANPTGFRDQKMSPSMLGCQQAARLRLPDPHVSREERDRGLDAQQSRRRWFRALLNPSKTGSAQASPPSQTTAPRPKYAEGARIKKPGLSPAAVARD
ncbi:hypothetical protein TARUN_2525 [Trichoderma arundinaceum]|uniref:Uncharacterized protein n=1 Tax=Trichoderma arundinaceum TaxID=490622 RepID=A0A395NUE0_TRIAR|nr:hypothetical protein TARUN_2525 [Trichoderma arundinaceum]